MREMESHGEQTHFVKRVVLPSGKTIEVVYFQELEETPPSSPPAERHQSLHVCVDCGSHLVYPVEWEESGPENWSVLLHCPNCDLYRDGVFAQETVEWFDEELGRRLSKHTEVVGRQLALLNWWFERIALVFPRKAIIRYEDIIATQGMCLEKIVRKAVDLRAELASRNTNVAYPLARMAPIAERLLSCPDGAYWDFYEHADVERLLVEWERRRQQQMGSPATAEP
jgi:hypothetical protein